MDISIDYQIFSLQKFGGISRYFVELCAALSKQKKDTVSIYAYDHMNFYLSDDHKNRNIILDNKKNSKYTAFIRNMCKFHADFINSSASILHKTYYYDAINFKRNSRSVLTVYDMTHEIYPNYFRRSKITSLAKKIAVDQADHILCISKSTRDDLIRILNCDERKITVTPLAVSSDFLMKKNLHESRNKEDFTEKPYILYVGSRAGYKNFYNFVKAYSVNNRIMRDFDILCFGGGNPTSAEIEFFIQSGVDLRKVHFRSGSDDELIKAYSNAHFLVYPSEYEGFGLPLLEAMTLGCPVVCSNTSSLPEVVGQAAVTFNPSSVEDMSTAFEAASYDSGLRHEKILSGYERTKLFDWDKTAALTANAYRELL